MDRERRQSNRSEQRLEASILWAQMGDSSYLSGLSLEHCSWKVARAGEADDSPRSLVDTRALLSTSPDSPEEYILKNSLLRRKQE